MDKSLKVAHIARRFTTHSWGGIEEALIHLCSALKDQRAQSEIFTTTLLDPKPSDTINQVPIHRYPAIFPWLGLSQSERKQMEKLGGNCFSFQMLRALYSSDIDLIHTHVQHRMGASARWAARKKGIPYIVSIHGDFLTIPSQQRQELEAPFKSKWEWGKAIGWWLGSRRVLADADAIICVNPTEASELQKAYPHKKIFSVPNGVNSDPFKQGDSQHFKKEYNLQGRRYILSVGRIDPQKNQKLLVEAFDAIKDENKELDLVLIGAITNEAYHKELKDQIQRLGLSNRVHLIDSIQPQSPLLYSAYKGADLFVLPSLAEPFGIVLLEAWAAGMPVIASRVGGIPSFVKHDSNGLLFESGNTSELIQHLSTLLKQPDIAEKLTKQSQIDLQKYSWEDVAAQYLDIYQQVLYGY